MEAENLCQEIRLRRLANRDINPDHGIVSAKQLRYFTRIAVFDPRRTDQLYVHASCSFQAQRNRPSGRSIVLSGNTRIRADSFQALASAIAAMGVINSGAKVRDFVQHERRSRFLFRGNYNRSAAHACPAKHRFP